MVETGRVTITKGGLSRQLLISGSQLAGLGLIIVFVAFCTTLWLRTRLAQQTERHAPSVSASLHLVGDVSDSLAQLRGWVAIGDPSFRERRARIWTERIWPALARLDHLLTGSDAAEARTLRALLGELESCQWDVEDVAQTPGNFPARVLHDQKLSAVQGGLTTAVADLTRSESDRGGAARATLLIALSRVREPLFLAGRYLAEFIDTGHEAAQIQFSRETDRARQGIESLRSLQAMLSAQQQDLFSKLDLEFRGFLVLSQRALALRRSSDSQVAPFLLASQAVPLAKRIKNLGTGLSERQTQSMLQHSAQANRYGAVALWGLGALALVLLVMSLVLPRRTAVQLLKPLSALVDATQRLSRGELSHDVAVTSDDEIGELTVSFNEMRGALQQSNEKLATEAWLQKHQAALVDQITGNLSVAEVSSRALSYLLEVLPAPAGAVFGRDDEEMVLVARMGTVVDSGDDLRYAIGVGLVGRVAEQGDPLLLSGCPDGYLRLESGLGSAPSAGVLIFPLGPPGNVLGVLELAFLADPSAQAQSLLDRVREGLGIALGAAAARERSEDLLTQTIQQARDLRQQQVELRSINKELDNNKYKSEFLSNMSHELRSPLNSILLLSDSLASNRDGNLKDSQIESARVVHSGARELLELIDETLDFAKLEAGRVEVQIESVSLIEVVQSLSKQFAPVAEGKGVELTTVVHDDAPKEMQTDRLRLGQILKNLLSNALKFTDQGAVSLQVGMADPGSRPAALASTRAVVAFSIQDSGIGVPRSKRALIFEPFQQADGSVTRSHGGTGLGLSISRDLAGLLGGELQLSRSSDSGSTFTLHLPCEAPVPQDPPSPPAEPTVRGKQAGIPAGNDSSDLASSLDPAGKLAGRSALLVDDDVRNIFALGVVLTEVGMTVESAVNGQMGLDKLRNSVTFDVVIMDVTMPVMDGLEAMKIIRSSTEYPDLPIVAMPATESARTRQECIAAGATEFLAKPVEPEKLVTLLCELVPSTQEMA